MSLFWLMFVINAPLLAEVTRKYLIPNDVVFLCGDILACITLMGIFFRGKILTNRIPQLFYLLMLIFLVYTAILHLFTGNQLGVYGVGLRITLMPIIYLLISAHFLKTQPRGTQLLYYSVCFWIVIAGAMAFAQIALGRDHPINTVWGKEVGTGDYVGDKGALLMKDLFRPTSIFTHTGKFGQSIFVLVLFRWCYLFFSNRKNGIIAYSLVLFDLGAVFASGQRGAFLFLAFSLLVLVYLKAQGSKKLITTLALSLVAGGVIFSALIFTLPEYGYVFSERFMSAIVAIPERLESNLFKPMQSIFKDFLIYGQGFGYYTFGSRIFGGKVIYRDVRLQLEGFGESSFIRICAETGFLAATILFFAFMSIYIKACKTFIRLRDTSQASSVIFYTLWIASLILWSNTADVFANSVSLFYGYALGGAILLHQSDLKIKKKTNHSLALHTYSSAHNKRPLAAYKQNIPDGDIRKIKMDLKN